MFEGGTFIQGADFHSRGELSFVGQNFGKIGGKLIKILQIKLTLWITLVEFNMNYVRQLPVTKIVPQIFFVVHNK